MNSFDLAKTCEMEFTKGADGKEVLLRDGEHQVMMEWEKPYMEACIDELQPKGDVLEIGFGCGYSARQIQKYKPKSHTIIECHPIVTAKAKKDLGFHPTLGNYDNVHWVEGTWQEELHKLNQFDTIFFDDYPLEAESDDIVQYHLSQDRFYIFFDIVLDWHMKSGAKLSCYVGSPECTKSPLWQQRVVNNPKIQYSEKIIDIELSNNCNYYRDPQAVIPIIEKL